MRAISLWQPHATLMSLLRPEPNPRRLAEKVFETRPQWARRVGLGELVICAAKTPDGFAAPLPSPIRETLNRHGFDFAWRLPFGAAVCVVDVVAVWETCKPSPDGDRWRLVRGIAQLRSIHASARNFGDFSPGRILLQCENVRPLAEPVPVRGYQQIFHLKPHEEAAVRAQLQHAEAS